MIFTGSWLISQFEWLLYLFGAFLLFTGVKMALAKEDAPASATNRWYAGSAATCG
jgi:predicted tellurium resistance membrane protein TerC